MVYIPVYVVEQLSLVFAEGRHTGPVFITLSFPPPACQHIICSNLCGRKARDLNKTATHSSKHYSFNHGVVTHSILYCKPCFQSLYMMQYNEHKEPRHVFYYNTIGKLEVHLESPNLFQGQMPYLEMLRKVNHSVFAPAVGSLAMLHHPKFDQNRANKSSQKLNIEYFVFSFSLKQTIFVLCWLLKNVFKDVRIFSYLKMY